MKNKILLLLFMFLTLFAFGCQTEQSVMHIEGNDKVIIQKTQELKVYYNNEEVPLENLQWTLSDYNVASIEIEQDIIQANDKLAYENRKIFDEKGVFAVDLVGAVGSGKTSLLETLIDEMDDDIGVIAGDILSKFDAKRIENKRRIK